MRGGQAVRKSRLVLDVKAAKKVKVSLEARAAGIARAEAAKAAGLKDKAVASLVAIERNALTYSGHTVWNQRRKVRPTRDDPRQTMSWRPRSEWMVSDEPTHEALITRDEAERVLATSCWLVCSTRPTGRSGTPTAARTMHTASARRASG
jgi:hypothetical protein